MKKESALTLSPFPTEQPRREIAATAAADFGKPAISLSFYTEAEVATMTQFDNFNNEEEELLLQYEIDAALGIAESRAKYRKILQASIAKWVKNFQEGRIDFKTVDDLEKLVALDLKLQADE